MSQWHFHMKYTHPCAIYPTNMFQRQGVNFKKYCSTSWKLHSSFWRLTVSLHKGVQISNGIAQYKLTCPKWAWGGTKKLRLNELHQTKSVSGPVCPFVLSHYTLEPILTQNLWIHMVQFVLSGFCVIRYFKHAKMQGAWISFCVYFTCLAFSKDNNYIILDGIEGWMRIYCTRHEWYPVRLEASWISFVASAVP